MFVRRRLEVAVVEKRQKLAAPRAGPQKQEPVEEFRMTIEQELVVEVEQPRLEFRSQNL